MNKKLKQKLEKTIQICEAMLEERRFHVSCSEIDLIPVPVMTKSRAKKEGLVLKRSAKPIGAWGVQVGRECVKVTCDIYMASSFKLKEAK